MCSCDAWCMTSSWPQLFWPFRMPGLSAIILEWPHPWLFLLLALNYYVNPFFYLTQTICSCHSSPSLCFTPCFFPYLTLLPPSIFLPLSRDISAFLPKDLPTRLTSFFLFFLLTVELGDPFLTNDIKRVGAIQV